MADEQVEGYQERERIPPTRAPGDAAFTDGVDTITTGDAATDETMTDEGGTASVVLGAAAGTLAGAFLGPVGAIVGAIAGGALASTVTGMENGDAADVTDLDQPDRR